MRALSATLAAAIDSPSRVPALTVRVEDRPPLVDRCAWEDLAVSGPGLRRVSHCTGMDDGAVARAVVTTDGNAACCRDPLDGTPPSSWLVASAGATATGNAIGIATNGAEVDSPEALLQAADRALYRAKSHGRNRVEVYQGGTGGVGSG